MRSDSTSTAFPVIQVVCEFLEAVIHHVLYSKGLYPPESFERRRLYGIGVQRSRYPELVTYISQAVADLAVRTRTDGTRGPGEKEMQRPVNHHAMSVTGAGCPEPSPGCAYCAHHYCLLLACRPSWPTAL